jgi:hypothetical protein
MSWLDVFGGNSIADRERDREKAEFQDFLTTITPSFEHDAHRRKKTEAAIAKKLERQQSVYDRELDEELDAEETLLAEQDREEREEREETDPRRLWARKERREREAKEIEQLVLSVPKLQGPPSFFLIRRQDLKIRREKRAQERHEEAEAKAGIPARQKKWERRREEIDTAAEKALTTEDERHFHDRKAITEKRDRDLQELGEYPVLPKPPIRVPNISVADYAELAKRREQLDGTVRELEHAGAMGAPGERGSGKPAHPEIAKARQKARLLTGRR